MIGVVSKQEIFSEKSLLSGPIKESTISVRGTVYTRVLIRTRLINGDDDLMDLLKEYVALHIQHSDVLFISEKVLALTQNRIIRIDAVRPTRLAKFLSRHVDNKFGTKDFKGFGHGTAQGMELFIQEAGVPRVLVAAAVAAITRPLGLHGWFYRIAGQRAKSVDCPMSFDLFPYTQYAKRSPLHPNKVAREIQATYNIPTIIVDANYQGAFSLGKSSRSITERFIGEVLKDNPAGQADEQTPFFLVRKS